jgi:hypothetical protein
MIEYPEAISSLEFVCARFVFEFQEPFDLDLERMLRLRRDLRTTAQQVLDATDDGSTAFTDLFDPPLATDPVALKRFQRPGPAFVLQPDPQQCRRLDCGDSMDLRVIFWGKGMTRLSHFARVLQMLGHKGLHSGEGHFELIEIFAENAAEEDVELWSFGQPLDALTPPLIPLAWHLDRKIGEDYSLLLEFVTPARLISHGRPLFTPAFDQLFPFVLRRVSSMIHAQFGVEFVDDPQRYKEISRTQVHEVENSLVWRDWRTLDGCAARHDLGGVSGTLEIAGEGLKEITWILRVGALMNLGKGASFGAGFYRIS